MSFQVINVDKLDVVHEILTTNLWLTFKWVDEMIRWNPTEYWNITQLRFQRDKIWTPNIVIQDTLAYVPYLGSDDLPVIVTNDGSARFDVEVKAQTGCKIIITAFPFDQHECRIVIGSDTYFLNELYIPHFAANEFPIGESSEWEVLRSRCRYCCLHPRCLTNMGIFENFERLSSRTTTDGFYHSETFLDRRLSM